MALTFNVQINVMLVSQGSLGSKFPQLLVGFGVWDNSILWLPQVNSPLHAAMTCNVAAPTEKLRAWRGHNRRGSILIHTVHS